MTAPAPGWYDDPSGDPGRRWWDGTRWTGNVRPPVSAPPPPAPARLAPPGPGRQPGLGGYPPAAYDTTGATGASGPVPGFPAAPTAPPACTAAGDTPPAGPPTFAARNRQSLIAAGVAVAYLLLAVGIHLVFIGIVPALLAFRALRAREPLSVPAAVISAVAVVVALTQLAR